MSLPDPSPVVVPRKRFTNLDLWRELFVASRFGLVGISSTAVHITIVWLLLGEIGMTPISANTLAFLAAFGVSFLGNYMWTFRSPGSPRRALVRFLIIAASAFAANTLLLAFLMRQGWFSPVASTVFSASVVPAISYSASRLWGFNRIARDF